jgi:hypothetical protein
MAGRAVSSGTAGTGLPPARAGVAHRKGGDKPVWFSSPAPGAKNIFLAIAAQFFKFVTAFFTFEFVDRHCGRSPLFHILLILRGKGFPVSVIDHRRKSRNNQELI